MIARVAEIAELCKFANFVKMAAIVKSGRVTLLKAFKKWVYFEKMVRFFCENFDKNAKKPEWPKGPK